MTRSVSSHRTLYLVLFILLVGIFLRTFQFQDNPPRCTLLWAILFRCVQSARVGTRFHVHTGQVGYNSMLRSEIISRDTFVASRAVPGKVNQ